MPVKEQCSYKSKPCLHQPGSHTRTKDIRRTCRTNPRHLQLSMHRCTKKVRRTDSASPSDRSSTCSTVAPGHPIHHHRHLSHGDDAADAAPPAHHHPRAVTTGLVSGPRAVEGRLRPPAGHGPPTRRCSTDSGSNRLTAGRLVGAAQPESNEASKRSGVR